MTAELDLRLMKSLRGADDSQRAGRPGLAYINMLNASHAAKMIAAVEGRAMSDLPEWWFTYAGDAAARNGTYTKASFLWPKNQRLIQEAKQRLADAAQ